MFTSYDIQSMRAPIYLNIHLIPSLNGVKASLRLCINKERREWKRERESGGIGIHLLNRSNKLSKEREDFAAEARLKFQLHNSHSSKSYLSGENFLSQRGCVNPTSCKTTLFNSITQLKWDRNEKS